MAGAGLTVMLYDWILTLSVEVSSSSTFYYRLLTIGQIRYIWRARWTLVKALFLINRYFVPLTIGFGIYGAPAALLFNQLSHFLRMEWKGDLDQCQSMPCIVLMNASSLTLPSVLQNLCPHGW